MEKQLNLSSRHLSVRTLRLLTDCASGNASGYDASFTDGGSIMYVLPRENTPHLPGDLAACLMKALDEGVDRILFTESAKPVDDLPVYPTEEAPEWF